MNFFEYQDRARRNTGLLVSLFALAVLLLIAITTLLAAAMVTWSRGQAFSLADIGQLLGWDTVATIALTVTAAIALGSLYKLRQLADGGRAVAESLGGRKINIAPRNQLEKRAINVVEEMAIASGTPVPDVYLIEDDAINAFAAGYKATDAVIGLTRGCIEKLSRHQLQGVVAHEFSHIFNGDMRLNIRIVGLLNGILIIGMLGYWLLRGGHFGGRGRAALFGVGAGLMVVGYTGTFFGNLIKSAVSRQREFLADASAVQFTRDNSGIAGALKKIGGYSAGSHLASPKAAEFSHMYFASGLRRSLANLFSTHPPLAQRIGRLDPAWNGRYPNTDSEPMGFSVSPQEDAQVMGIATAAPLDKAAAPLNKVFDAVDNSIGNPGERQLHYGRQLLQRVPAALQQAARDPFSARALVYHLLLHRDEKHREQQRQMLEKIAHPAVIRELNKLEPELQALTADIRLPLLDMCVPALKALVPQQYQVFKRNLIKLLRSDGKVEVWEWSLYRVLMHALEKVPDRQRLSPTRAPKRGAERDAARFILAAVAHASDTNYLPAKRAYVAGLGALQLEITPLPAAADITLQRLDKAIAIAAAMAPLRKPALLKAMAVAMSHDGVIEAEELELLRAVADSLDCPMPPLVPAAATGAASPRAKATGEVV